MRERPREDFSEDPFLRDLAERNLEVAAQCCIDICHRIIAEEGAEKPASYQDAIVRQGELGVLPPAFARSLAPLAGFRNVLAHHYLDIDWDEVYAHLQRLDELKQFAEYIRSWLQQKENAHG